MDNTHNDASQGSSRRQIPPPVRSDDPVAVLAQVYVQVHESWERLNAAAEMLRAWLPDQAGILGVMRETADTVQLAGRHVADRLTVAHRARNQ